MMVALALCAISLLPIEARRASWLETAEACKPMLVERVVRPVSLVKPVEDESAFLGCRMAATNETTVALNCPLVPGETFYFDFGEHLTGRFSVELRRFGAPVDAPVRLHFEFGEVPAEIVRPYDRSRGLPASWHQDEWVTADCVPSTVTVPRRLSFRYVKLTVDSCSRNGRCGLKDVRMAAVTSADETKLLPFKGTGLDAEIDRVSNRTLRECMQTVLEDGPKRDRRLWLGDLRLQALANYATYRNFDVVKRSLLVLAGTSTTNGLVSTAAYENPAPEAATSRILDYTALFANTVEEYLLASDDRETCESLWPLVLKQTDFTQETLDGEGLVRENLSCWQFIDWQPDMKKQAAEQAVIISSLKATERLGRKLGHAEDVAFIPAVVAKMAVAARRRLWDVKRGLWVSNGDNVSWMSQAWMALAGIATPEEARRSLRSVMSDSQAVRPVTPYAHHYFTEALFQSGLREEALAHLRGYWGSMVRLGADTFWEVWMPEDLEKSPYNNVLINSFCHAWSCTAGYLLRKYL